MIPVVFACCGWFLGVVVYRTLGLAGLLVLWALMFLLLPPVWLSLSAWMGRILGRK